MYAITFFEGGKLKRSQLCGRYGCREENYIYKENAFDTY